VPSVPSLGDTAAAVGAVSAELVRLRRATESLRHLLSVASGVDLEVGAMSALFTILRLGPQRPSDLARALSLDPSTTSRHVSALIRRGYACRVPDPADRRAHRVEATDAGRAVHARVASHRDRMLTELVGEWPGDDLRDLARLLARFNDTLEGVDVADLARRTADPSTPGGTA
jgi:DNA-binding MarR family transcriptional regulator